MTQLLKDRIIAALVTPGFEEREFTGPASALKKEGARVLIIAPQDGEIRSWNNNRWGKAFRVNQHLNSARYIDFDALLLPSVISKPDIPPINERLVKFAGDFVRMDKPIVAIGRAPVILVKTGLLKGRTVASHISVCAEVQQAGAEWMNQEIAIDQGLITSNGPTDMTFFNAKMVQALSDEMRDYHQAWWGT